VNYGGKKYGCKRRGQRKKRFCASRYGLRRGKSRASAVSKLKDGENGFGVEVVTASKVRRANHTEIVRPPK
jgi:hypothetical protein